VSEPTIVCPWWQFWHNPIIRRFAKSRLRLLSAGFWLLLTLIITLFIFLIIYVALSEREFQTAAEAARAAVLPIFILQAVILMLMGTGTVASGVIQEKIDDTLDYTRMTPLSPATKIIGYLLGLPIREYAMVGLTMPFMLYLLWRGGIPWSATLIVYTVFFASVWLYHLTGMVAGMVVEKWRMAARLSQGLILLLYLILPQLSQIGLLFFEYLTVRPVLADQWLPHIFDPQDLIQNPLTWLAGRPVPLFTLEISSYFFSLLVQGLLATVFFRMLLRKWKDAEAHALTKLDGIIVYTGFLLLTFGNLWPTLTRQPTGVPMILQENNFDMAVAFGIPFLFVIATLAVAMGINHTITPQVAHQQCGIRRRKKLGLASIPWNWDEASAWPVTLFTGVGLFVVHGIALNLMHGAGYFEDIVMNSRELGMLPLAAALFFTAYALMLEWLGGKKRALILLLLGLVPILTGIFLSALSDAFDRAALWVSALSGVALLPMSAVFPLLSEAPEEMQERLPGATIFGLGFHLLLLVVVFVGWWRHRRNLTQAEG